MEIAPKINPPLRTLLGPGPSPVNLRVLQSLSLPVIGHLDPVFLKIMDESMAMLRELFQTKNRLALPISGTGTAGMETCFVNLLEPGDPVLSGSTGCSAHGWWTSPNAAAPRWILLKQSGGRRSIRRNFA